MSSIEKKWFYENGGRREGPVAESAVIEMIQTGKISYGSLVWEKGFQNWQQVENTELSVYLREVSPPPLSGEQVNNTFAWILAFAPLIGSIIQGFIVGIKYADIIEKLSPMQIMSYSENYWYVTLLLNIALSFLDERALAKSGHNTAKFKGWVWLVPVYLYQRAKNLKQSNAYFIVWCVCFAFWLLL
jgi:hypothetical protein